MHERQTGRSLWTSCGRIPRRGGHALAPLAAALCAAFAPALVGCSSAPIPETPALDAAPFAGPALRLDSSGTEHVALFDAPNPGYLATLDYVGIGPKGKEIFVTLRRPDPRFVYSTVIVTQHIATGILSREPALLFAREIEHDFKGPLEGYAPAATPPSAR